MKKPIFIAIFLSLLVTSNVFAKTEGNYIGINLINSKSSYSDSLHNRYSIQNDNKKSVGISFKHAINYNDLFIAPEVFYDHTDIKMTDSDSDEWKINSRIGARLNIGYDIADEFSVFVNAGFTRNSYKVNWESINSYRQDSSGGFIYGFGASYSVNQNIDLLLAYDISSLEMQEPILSGNKYDFDLKTIKAGISYKF